MCAKTCQQVLALFVVGHSLRTHNGHICADAEHDIGMVHSFIALVACPAKHHHMTRRVPQDVCTEVCQHGQRGLREEEEGSQFEAGQGGMETDLNDGAATRSN